MDYRLQKSSLKFKPKVLFILHLPPPVHGAAIVGKLIKQSEVVEENFNCDFINLSTSTKMEEIGKGGINKLCTTIKVYRQVLKHLFSKQYDLCYLTLTTAGVGFLKDLTIVTLLKMFNCNIIYHFHNKGINSKSWFNKLLYKFAFRKTKSILLSPCLYMDFKTYLNRNDAYYCPNGIPIVETYTPLKNISRNCRILFLSNMVVEKGVLNLIEACSILKDKMIEFECHFVGEWSDISKKDFEISKINYGLQQHVFAHGAKFNNEKKEFFLSADIFVLPTKKDCFPLVLLEAMNYSLPVISTHEGGIPDIVIDNETGYLVAPNDIHGLVSKLEALINDPYLRNKFGIAGRKRFLEFYTIEKFEKKFVEILDTVIKDD